MIKNVGENTVIFKKENDATEPGKVIIYRSPSRITSMTYAGPANEKIKLSVSIPDEFKTGLAQMNAQVSLGTSKVEGNNEYRNIHIYSPKAEYLDGIHRICYLAATDSSDQLRVSEYQRRSRGSTYSGLYKVLEKRMQEEGFPTVEPGEYVVTRDLLATFVDLINEVSKKHVEGQYTLVLQDRVEQTSQGTFNVVYYQEQRLPETQMSDDEALEAFQALIKFKQYGRVELKAAAIAQIKGILSTVV